MKVFSCSSPYRICPVSLGTGVLKWASHLNDFLSMFWDQGWSSFIPPNKATRPTHGPRVDPWRIWAYMKVSSNKTFFIVLFFILSIRSQFISQDCSLLDQKRSICSVIAHVQDTSSWGSVAIVKVVCEGHAHSPPAREGVYVFLDLGLLGIHGALSETPWSAGGGAGQWVPAQHHGKL